MPDVAQRYKLKEYSINKIENPLSTVLPAYRFEVRNGDCYTVYDCTEGKNRTELTDISDKIKLKGNLTQWYSINLLVDENFSLPNDNVGVTLIQFKVTDSYPALDFFMRKTRDLNVKMDYAYKICNCWDTSQKSKRVNQIASFDAFRGRWIEITIGAVWSEYSEGQIVIYIDGNLAFSYFGPNIPTGQYLYPKFGIYQWNVTPSSNEDSVVVRMTEMQKAKVKNDLRLRYQID